VYIAVNLHSIFITLLKYYIITRLSTANEDILHCLVHVILLIYFIEPKICVALCSVCYYYNKSIKCKNNHFIYFTIHIKRHKIIARLLLIY